MDHAKAHRVQLKFLKVVTRIEVRKEENNIYHLFAMSKTTFLY